MVKTPKGNKEKKKKPAHAYIPKESIGMVECRILPSITRN
jgi:hypothetical protein